MKVILLDEIKGKGGEGDVVEVAQGYAENFLFPKKLAVAATKGNLKQLDERRNNIAKREAVRLATANETKAAFEGKTVTVDVKVGDEGILFGSVTAAMIADAIKAQLGMDIDRKRVELGKPIKVAGAHTVAISLYREIKAEVVVLVGVTAEELAAEAEVEEAAEAAEAETAGVPVLVGQHRRHNPFVNKAKEIIESGELGKLTVSSFHYMIYKNDEYFDVEWRRKKGAGPILVNLVHDVDLLRYLLGEPVAVQGMQSSAARGFETEDSAVVNVRFADGALASMTISDATASPWNWEATAREDPQYRPFDADAYFIGGTKGALSLPRLHQFSYDGASNWHKPLQMEIPAVDPALPHKMQLKHFVKVVRREVEPVVTPADNVKTLTLLNAIKEAAETGQLVEL